MMFTRLLPWALLLVYLAAYGALAVLDAIYRPSPYQFESSLATDLHWLQVLAKSLIPVAAPVVMACWVLALWQRWWTWFGVGALFLAIEAGIPLARSTGPYWNSDLNQPADLRVASFNMQANVPALEDFAALSQEVDVIALFEVPRRAAELIDFADLYPEHSLHQAPYHLGGRLSDGSMALLVKGEARVQHRQSKVGSARIAFEAVLERGGQPYRVFAMHPLLPAKPSYVWQRDVALAHVSDIIRRYDELPTILMGDLNTSPFELRGWGLPGKLVGNPFRLTWSGMGNALHLRIDHIRLIQSEGARLAVLGQVVGPDLGSDHLPLFASFVTKNPAEQR